LEYCFWAIGIAFLSYVGYFLIDGQLEQRRANKDLDRILSTHKIELIPHQTPSRPMLPHGDLVGRLEIPRLNLSLITFEGTDEPVLKKGVGHLSGSSLPGDPGNVVLAAHRDTYFRKLKDIREGDEIIVTTPESAKRYIVHEMKVIDPSETQVLNATSSPTLTLITCYPFYFVGHAPKRFVVLAHPAPDSDPPKTVVAEAKPGSNANSKPAQQETSVKTVSQPAPAAPAMMQPKPFRTISRVSSVSPRAVAHPSSPAEEESDSATNAPGYTPPELIELPQDQPAVQTKRSWNPTRFLGKLNIFAKKKPTQSTLADSRNPEE